MFRYLSVMLSNCLTTKRNEAERELVKVVEGNCADARLISENRNEPKYDMEGRS